MKIAGELAPLAVRGDQASCRSSSRSAESSASRSAECSASCHNGRRWPARRRGASGAAPARGRRRGPRPQSKGDELRPAGGVEGDGGCRHQWRRDQADRQATMGITHLALRSSRRRAAPAARRQPPVRAAIGPAVVSERSPLSAASSLAQHRLRRRRNEQGGPGRKPLWMRRRKRDRGAVAISPGCRQGRRPRIPVGEHASPAPRSCPGCEVVADDEPLARPACRRPGGRGGPVHARPHSGHGRD